MGLRMGGVLFLGALMVFGAQGLAPAQEENAVMEPSGEEAAGQEADLQEDVSITFGSVIKVADNQITILEYDFDADQDVQMDYAIDEDTEFENVSSSAALKTDDPVEIVYVTIEGKKIALIVKKEELDMGEGLTAAGDETVTEDDTMSEDLLMDNEDVFSDDDVMGGDESSPE